MSASMRSPVHGMDLISRNGVITAEFEGAYMYSEQVPNGVRYVGY